MPTADVSRSAPAIHGYKTPATCAATPFVAGACERSGLPAHASALPDAVRLALNKPDTEDVCEDGDESDVDNGSDWDTRSLPDKADAADCSIAGNDGVVEEEAVSEWHQVPDVMAPFLGGKEPRSTRPQAESLIASVFACSSTAGVTPAIGSARVLPALAESSIASAAAPSVVATGTDGRSTTAGNTGQGVDFTAPPAAITTEAPTTGAAGGSTTRAGGATTTASSRLRAAAPSSRAARPGPTRWTLPKYLASVKLHVLKTGLFLRMLSYTINPPDALAAGRVLFPEDWCLPRVLVYAPFDMRGPYRPSCPTCGTDAVIQDGWSTFRRVIDLDECIFVVCRRYRCTKKHKGVCFLAWNTKLLEKAPPYIRHSFPVIFTHRLGVTQSVFDAMRSWTASGAGFGPFADFIKENHTRRHHRKELAYLSRLSDVTAESPFGEPRVSGCTAEAAAQFPHFPIFSDSYGANGCHGSKNFFRSVYTRGMRRLEVKIKKRCAMVPARMLSGDHFFKIIKCNFLFRGKKLFMAAYSLVNEHTEVMATVLTQSKSLEELRHMLISVQQRMIGLGLPAPQIDVFFTDNPTAEASFLEGIYPGLRKTTVALGTESMPTIPVLKLPPDDVHSKHYITDTVTANMAIDIMRREVTKEGGGRAIGFDAEWNIDGGPTGRGPGVVRVVQLSSPTTTLILHISRMSSFPHELLALLADVEILKVGKSIGGDCRKLFKEHGAVTKSSLELANFAKSRHLVGNATIGLAGLVAVLLQKTLDKDPGVRLSNWSRPLSEEQQTYAALDSYASLLVYEHVLQSSSPVPEPSATLKDMELYVTDASGTCRVAVCSVADAQPTKNGNFLVGAKGRVWVKVVRVLVPSYALPFAVKRQPTTLAALMQHNEQIGKDPVFVVARAHLRDVRHPAEKRLAAQRAHAAHPVVSIAADDGEVDALTDLEAPIQRMLQAGVVPGGGGSAAAADFSGDDADEEELGAGLAAGDVRDDDEDDTSVNEPSKSGEMECGDGLRGLSSGVKGDIMHLMDRVLRHVPKGHGATPLFSRAFSHALMFYNAKDSAAAQRVAAELWPEKTWRQVQYYMSSWVNRRVRRTVPHPDVIVPRLEKLFKEFGGILDASTKQSLFSAATWKAAGQVIQTVKEGWVTDPVGVPLYVLRRYDKNNLPLWLCCRGTNSNEGSVHQKLVKNFLGMKGASAELISFALLEWVGRHNQRAGRKNRTGAPDIGHADVWIVDDIIFFQEFIFGKRTSHQAHQRADEFELPDFYCGVTSLSPDILEDCGLPGVDMMQQLAPLIPKLTLQKQYLASTMGSGVPLLPVHTTEEKLLYGEVQRTLLRELRGKPSAVAMTVAFNRLVADDWMRRAAKLSSAQVQAAKRVAGNGKKMRVAVVFEQPSIYFKSTSLMASYQSFYERTQNEASTILLSHPEQSRTAVAAANAATTEFGDDVSGMTPVSGRPALNSRPAQQGATAASAGSVVTIGGTRSSIADSPVAPGQNPSTDRTQAPGGETSLGSVAAGGAHLHSLSAAAVPHGTTLTASLYSDVQRTLAAYEEIAPRTRGSNGEGASVAGGEAGSGASGAGAGAGDGDLAAAAPQLTRPATKRRRRHCQTCHLSSCPGHNRKTACRQRAAGATSTSVGEETPRTGVYMAGIGYGGAAAIGMRMGMPPPAAAPARLRPLQPRPVRPPAPVSIARASAAAAGVGPARTAVPPVLAPAVPASFSGSTASGSSGRRQFLGKHPAPDASPSRPSSSEQ